MNHNMTLVPRYFVVTWSRGNGIYTQNFVPLSEPAREGYPKYTCRAQWPKESAISYARDLRAMGANARVYESVEGILHRVEVL